MKNFTLNHTQNNQDIDKTKASIILTENNGLGSTNNSSR